MIFVDYVIAGVLFIVHMACLFQIAQSKKDRSVLFFTLLYIPQIVIPLCLFLLTILCFSPVVLLILVLFSLERVIWGMTLYDVAGEDKLVWFIIIFLVPFFGWSLYKITGMR